MSRVHDVDLARSGIVKRKGGFSQELLAATPKSDPSSGTQKDALPRRFPHLASIARAALPADPDSVVGAGCDDQFEFEFALDLLLDGVEFLHAQHWSSAGPSTPEA